MESLQGVLEASPDAVLVVDEEGVIQQANRNVPMVLGYSPTEIEGKVVEELLLEKDRHDHVQFRQEYMADPESRPMGRELDLYALHKDGTDFPVEISLGPIRRDGDLYVVATITDITKREERERELQRQNERLEKFASIVSHDLRNPLNVAAGQLEFAREECDSERLDAAARALDRMDTLIDDLLTLAREGGTGLEVDPADLAAVVDDCWRSVETGAATLVTKTDLTIRADEGRLRQLLENLIQNAVDHGEPTVTVTIGDLNDGFYVADDGPGIPPAKRERVFETGYSTANDGTGYGLSIVQEIVDAHEWEIDVTVSEDGGARFEITSVALADG
jgi:PAS domain S-box-containing protein